MSLATSLARDADARREALLDAAERAVHHGGPEVSMAVIAGEAGVTKPVVYRVFSDKSDLYQALADRHTERLLTALRHAIASNDDRRLRTRAVIETFLTVVDEQPEIYRFLVHRAATEDPEVGRAVRSFIHRFGVELGRGIAFETGQPEESAIAQIWGAAMIGGVQSAAERWLEDRMGLTRGQLAEALTDLYFGAYASAPISHQIPTARSTK